ncbi:MAG TPA: inositol monophosphatase family protein [Caldilineaceae bacterium]|nr:inositol monophosphatase family protein [Caldilineaceae bacterium]
MPAHAFDHEAIIAVVEKAGQLVQRMRRDGLAPIQRKSSTIDLVTEADLASEALLREELQRLYPQVGFWGEESNQRPETEYYWLVDPIDGTTNFANNLPLYAINLALCQAEDPILAVTLQLPARLIYWAKAGSGAYQRDLDGSDMRLAVNQATNLRHTIVCTGFPYHRGESTDNNTNEISHFIPQAQSTRCLGSAALELALVATGALGAYWEGWLGPWDAAAGVLLVREAGGRVTDYAGNEWKIPGGLGLLADNGQTELHSAMLAGIQTARTHLTERKLPL